MSFQLLLFVAFRRIPNMIFRKQESPFLETGTGTRHIFQAAFGNLVTAFGKRDWPWLKMCARFMLSFIRCASFCVCVCAMVATDGENVPPFFVKRWSSSLFQNVERVRRVVLSQSKGCRLKKYSQKNYHVIVKTSIMRAGQTGLSESFQGKVKMCLH